MLIELMYVGYSLDPLLFQGSTLHMYKFAMDELTTSSSLQVTYDLMRLPIQGQGLVDVLLLTYPPTNCTEVKVEFNIICPPRWVCDQLYQLDLTR